MTNIEQEESRILERTMAEYLSEGDGGIKDRRIPDIG
jgi:hypothetical protein